MDMMQLEGLTKLMSREQDDEDGQGPSINYTPSTLSGGRAPGDDEPREELFATVLKTRKAHDPKVNLPPALSRQHMGREIHACSLRLSGTTMRSRRICLVWMTTPTQVACDMARFVSRLYLT
jgi:hypothetical protein